jgi:hypothetical protein
MPPPGGGVPLLTIDEKIMFAHWIDLGCPIDTAEGSPGDAFGWFLDDLKPTLTLSKPRAGLDISGFTSLQFGMADANSGIDIGTLSVMATFTVSGRPPGSELADLAVETADGIYEVPIGGSPGTLDEAHVTIEVADFQGNIKRIDRKFRTVEGLIFFDNFE